MQPQLYTVSAFASLVVVVVVIVLAAKKLVIDVQNYYVMAFFNVVSSMPFEKILKCKEKNL